jgi:polysaccharide biosynthesis protein PslG
VLGYPITEAYWTQMRVSGKDMPVLIQAYQRRVLTYVPDFEPTWQVQQGNVGQHYLEWITLNRENRLGNPDIVP